MARPSQSERSRGLRSCSTTCLELGQPGRATDFARLDAGSQWAENMIADVYLYQGKSAEALAQLQRLTPVRSREGVLRQVCLEHPPVSALEALGSRKEARLMRVRDAEPKFHEATYLAFCGQPQRALRLLRRTIAVNFCAYPSVDTDLLLANLRGLPEFAAVRTAAMACQQKFLAERAR